jgi:hypothetical protein
MTKPNIIFLDIDGVLNSMDYMNALQFDAALAKGLYNINAQDSHSIIRDKYGHHFDPRCVSYLQSIYNATRCDFVISSTWNQAGLATIQQMWIDRNLPGKVIDIIDCHDRANAILKWLHEHDYVIIEHCWCIIDDETMFDDIDAQFQKFQIKPNTRYGISLQDMLNVIRHFNHVNNDMWLCTSEVVKFAKQIWNKQ